jgi:hypothetical protein
MYCIVTAIQYHLLINRISRWRGCGCGWAARGVAVCLAHEYHNSRHDCSHWWRGEWYERVSSYIIVYMYIRRVYIRKYTNKDMYTYTMRNYLIYIIYIMVIYINCYRSCLAYQCWCEVARILGIYTRVLMLVM